MALTSNGSGICGGVAVHLRALAGAGGSSGAAAAAAVAAPTERCMLGSYGGFDSMVAVCLEAKAMAALAAASRGERRRVSEQLVRWCAHHRREQLASRAAQGDMELPETAEDAPLAVGAWSLERLHLFEQPPRFPSIYFNFASDTPLNASKGRLAQVAALLRRHPGLVLRVEGFGHPSAPRSLGRAVAQARATRTRELLLRQLLENPGPRAKAFARDGAGSPWHADGQLDSGVVDPDGYDEARGHSNVDFYEPRLIGRRLQAVGRWGQDPRLRNANFAEDVAADELWDSEARFRRVDFTVVRLLDPGADVQPLDLCH